VHCDNSSNSSRAQIETTPMISGVQNRVVNLCVGCSGAC